jgi:hypothetical protein
LIKKTKTAFDEAVALLEKSDFLCGQPAIPGC